MCSCREPVTSIAYFVTGSGNSMIRPGMLQDVSNTVSVAGLTLQAGPVTLYERQYSFVVHGEIASDIAARVFTAIKSAWDAQIPSAGGGKKLLNSLSYILCITQVVQVCISMACLLWSVRDETVSCSFLPVCISAIMMQLTKLELGFASLG